jgi:hypothetical protein
MPANNQHVREFATSHRLRVVVREDGEVVLLLGGRKPTPAAICRTGRTSLSDAHASFGLRGDLWRVHAGPATSRRITAIATRWRDLGLVPVVLDFEAWVDVPEDRLLEVANTHPSTRLRQRRELTEEQRAELAGRLARGRSEPPCSAGFGAPNSAPGVPGRMSGPREPDSPGERHRIHALSL